jgi:predicted ATPase
MSYDDGWEFGDPCVECGAETSAEHHRYCDDCYAEQQGWTRPARPESGTDPPSFVEGLARVRERLTTLEDAATVAFDNVERSLDALERRIAQLERRSAA